ncbi:hypothetical protein CDAR_527171 [Caerostris darwini]|uniref:Uncharacterized protein n=1 Tax=Caerostris darwini TaxID=1538125 RepID=A0AAV4WMD3_9ARAC|nr:hypothetical protein CDAR_527171 [Caerostris darwini]
MHIQSCYPTLNPSQLLQNEAFHRYRLTLEIIIKELMCSALNLSLKKGLAKQYEDVRTLRKTMCTSGLLLAKKKQINVALT